VLKSRLRFARRAGIKPLIVACIPALNEERTIARVLIKARKYVDKVVVCDDGSSDLTAEIAEGLGAEVLKHSRNMGYGAALASLFRRAEEVGADAMVTMDGDGQHDPEQVPRLLEPILSGEADVVIGSRFLVEEGETPAYRRAGVQMITRIACKATGLRVSDAQSGFRGYSRDALRLLRPTEMGMGASTEILARAAENKLVVKEVPVTISYGVERPSKMNPVYHAGDVVASTLKHYSVRHPLLLYGVPGLAAVVTGVIFWGWALQVFAATRQLSTNIVLVAFAASMLGLMLLTTAILLYVIVGLIRESR